MRESHRSADFQVRRLEERHAKLEERITALGRRNYLTAREQMEMQHLKKQKLATKDALEAMRSAEAAE